MRKTVKQVMQLIESRRAVIFTLFCVIYFSFWLSECKRYFSVSGPSIVTSSIGDPVLLHPMTIDLGSVQDEVVYAKCHVTNRSNLTVSMLDPIRSCGCTGVQMGSIIRPRESELVTINWDLRGRAGSMRTQVILRGETSDRKSFTVPVQIIADVTPRVSVTPKVLYFTAGKSESSVVFPTANGQELRFTRFVSSHRSISVANDPTGKYLTIAFDATAWTKDAGKVNLRFTFDLEDGKCVVLMSVHIRGPTVSISTSV